MIKNIPDLAFNLYKTKFKNDFISKKGHLKFADVPYSVLSN
jgi:hypothetical protein